MHRSEAGRDGFAPVAHLLGARPREGRRGSGGSPALLQRIDAHPRQQREGDQRNFPKIDLDQATRARLQDRFSIWLKRSIIQARNQHSGMTCVRIVSRRGDRLQYFTRFRRSHSQCSRGGFQPDLNVGMDKQSQQGATGLLPPLLQFAIDGVHHSKEPVILLVVIVDERPILQQGNLLELVNELICGETSQV